MKTTKNANQSFFVLTKTPPSILVILAIICYQLGAAIATQLFGLIGPGGTVLFRVGFSALFLVIAQKGLPKGVKSKTLLWTIAYGLSLAGMNYTFYSSFARIPLGIASTIEFAGPLAIAVIGSRRTIDFIWVTMATIGIILFAPWTGATIDSLGVLLALIAAFCWALYILLAAKVGKLLPGRDGLTLAMIFGGVAMIPIGVTSAGSALLNPFAIAAGLIVAFLSSTLPYSFEIEALRRMPTQVFGILVSLEPAIATCAGVLLLHQALSLRSICALILVTAASLGATIEKNKNKKTVKVAVVE